MSESKRPGGLTALAVLNFIGGGFNVLLVLGLAAIAAALSVAAEHPPDEETRKAFEAWQKMGSSWLYFIIGSCVVSAFLLIASGVGFLKQSKVWGRMMGNICAALSIASSAVFVFAIDKEAGGGFELQTVIWLIYPVLTLILLNTTFKEDFVR
ncbi:MAG TPA: hypothetical protein VFD82_23125 [Planctomycetota bacterium]|nr:hypothetical protein [Planctomycetota bacterium]